MKRAIFVFANLLLTMLVCVASSAAAPDDFSRLRERFVSPPRNAGTVTLYWLNGTITKAGIREQMRALRDRCGFGGVAPLTFYSMEPPTQPAYLSKEYFDVYGCILDTAKELGMTVVFYDDCDFPSGSAGDQMREKYPQSLMKYLARGRTTVNPHSGERSPLKCSHDKLSGTNVTQAQVTLESLRSVFLVAPRRTTR